MSATNWKKITIYRNSKVHGPIYINPEHVATCEASREANVGMQVIMSNGNVYSSVEGLEVFGLTEPVSLAEQQPGDPASGTGDATTGDGQQPQSGIGETAHQ